MNFYVVWTEQETITYCTISLAAFTAKYNLFCENTVFPIAVLFNEEFSVLLKIKDQGPIYKTLHRQAKFRF